MPAQEFPDLRYPARGLSCYAQVIDLGLVCKERFHCAFLGAGVRALGFEALPLHPIYQYQSNYLQASAALKYPFLFMDGLHELCTLGCETLQVHKNCRQATDSEAVALWVEDWR